MARNAVGKGDGLHLRAARAPLEGDIHRIQQLACLDLKFAYKLH